MLKLNWLTIIYQKQYKIQYVVGAIKALGREYMQKKKLKRYRVLLRQSNMNFGMMSLII